MLKDENSLGVESADNIGNFLLYKPNGGDLYNQIVLTINSFKQPKKVVRGVSMLMT